ncbi:MAG: KOW domain-containing RNA-binding protein [Bacillota bacterium]|jgi:ribosomal protein L14E/L6E/L27E
MEDYSLGEPGPASERSLRRGQVVSSKAGRDAGRFYAIMKVVDHRFVEVADGDRRSAKKPKRKNLRHLVVHKQVLEEVGRSLEAGQEISDADLKRALGCLAGPQGN